jgi:hypothetical protein
MSKLDFKCSCGNDELSAVYEEVAIHKEVTNLEVDDYGEITWDEGKITELEIESCRFRSWICSVCGAEYDWVDGEFVDL